jgi:hypothetical protein
MVFSMNRTAREAPLAARVLQQKFDKIHHELY